MSEPWTHRAAVEKDWKFLLSFYSDRIRNNEPVAEVNTFFNKALALIEQESPDKLVTYNKYYRGKISNYVVKRNYQRAFNVLSSIMLYLEGHCGVQADVWITLRISAGMSSIVHRICPSLHNKLAAKLRLFIIVGFITVFKHHTEIRDLLKHICEKEQIPYLEFIKDIKEIAKEEPEFI